MYIEIGESIASAFSQSIANKKNVDKYVDIMIYAMRSAKEKNNCIHTENESCAYSLYQLLEKERYHREANFFFYIYNNYSTYLANLKQSLNSYVKIEESSVPITEIKISNDARKIIVNADFASKSSFWSRMYFLPENVYDYRFFFRIALYKKKMDSRFSRISLSFEPEQAGGSRAIDIFSVRGKCNRFIYALLDSDVDSPFCEIRKDSTAGKFLENFKSGIPWPNAFYQILDVHETENLFSSPGFLERVCLSKSKKLDTYSQEIRQYYDLKKGYSYKDLQRNCYMRAQVKGVLPVCSKHTVIDKCKQDGFKCEKNIMPGFGKILVSLFGDCEESTEDIEKKVVNEFNMGFDQCYNQLIDPVKKEWDKIFLNFMTFFCAVEISGAGF